MFCFCESLKISKHTTLSYNLGYVPSDHPEAARSSFNQHLDAVFLWLPRPDAGSPPQPPTTAEDELRRNNTLIDAAMGWFVDIMAAKGDDCPPVYLLYKPFKFYADQEKDEQRVEAALRTKAIKMGFAALVSTDGVDLTSQTAALLGESVVPSEMGASSGSASREGCTIC
jgi:hypothetical protein